MFRVFLLLFTLGCICLIFLVFKYYISKGVFDEAETPLANCDTNMFEECLSEEE